MKSLLYTLLLLATGALIGCHDEENPSFSYRSSAVTAGPDFTDPRDNNVYHTIRVGNQLWLAENLRYTPNGYSLDGAFTWEEKPVDQKKMVPDDQILGQMIEELFLDPKFDGWKVDGTPIDNFILPLFKHFKRGRLTAAQLPLVPNMAAPTLRKQKKLMEDMFRNTVSSIPTLRQKHLYLRDGDSPPTKIGSNLSKLLDSLPKKLSSTMLGAVQG